MKYQVFLEDEALVIEADGYRPHGEWLGFYVVEGEGTETTFPPRWKQLLFGARKTQKRTEDRLFFHWVRTKNLRRLITVLPAKGDAA